jgi:hypothetical protein
MSELTPTPYGGQVVLSTPGASYTRSYTPLVVGFDLMMKQSAHRLACAGCDSCAGERLRRLERQFAQAGEDDYCDECGHTFAPYYITDEVEDVVL